MEDEEQNDPKCSRCGLRAFDTTCQKCGAPVVDKSDDEDEEYDWREKKR